MTYRDALKQLRKEGYLICPCGERISRRADLRYHWKIGHFNPPTLGIAMAEQIGTKDTPV